MTISSRRLIQQHAPEEFWGVLLTYRDRLSASMSCGALVWILSPEGQRMTEALRWIGTLRANRSARRDSGRARVYGQLYDAVRLMILQFADADAFDRRRLESVALVERLHVLYLAPLAHVHETEREKERGGAAAREAGYKEKLLAPENEARIVAEIRKSRGRNRDVQIEDVVLSAALQDLKPALSKKRLKECFGEHLNPPSRGPKAEGKGKKNPPVPG